MARLAIDGPDRRVDVGRIEHRHFLNCVGFGFDVAVLERSAAVRWLQGSFVYAYAALGQIFQYSGIEVAHSEESSHRRRLLLVVANGSWFGGTFQIAPLASCDDGLLDVIAIADSSPFGRIRLFVDALRGSHLRHPAVDTRQTRMVSLNFPSPPSYEVDGEYRVAIASTLDVECLHHALRVVGCGNWTGIVRTTNGRTA